MEDIRSLGNLCSVQSLCGCTIVAEARFWQILSQCRTSDQQTSVDEFVSPTSHLLLKFEARHISIIFLAPVFWKERFSPSGEVGYKDTNAVCSNGFFKSYPDIRIIFRLSVQYTKHLL
ncbi:unnamed protein product [Albugo candida]|uniref:Uncharacterized protein n=1 Tax=Albugo candida TaxID=65357 RepID=A0A024GHP1_9STRA|nr:unnamed protein product [Albugo candida]|eukprot:CCI46231.1 unnamed protein product [Albugo candida]